MSKLRSIARRMKRTELQETTGMGEMARKRHRSKAQRALAAMQARQAKEAAEKAEAARMKDAAANVPVVVNSGPLCANVPVA